MVMPETEQSLVFIKPDGVSRGLVGEVISRFEKKGFVIKGLKMLTMPPELADQHYAEHTCKAFFPGLKTFITSGPIVAIVLEGRNACEVIRDMVGATDSAKAIAGTIRGDYSLSGSQNIIHASDSVTSAEREIKIFFGQ